jgi:hypothetical protein
LVARPAICPVAVNGVENANDVPAAPGGGITNGVVVNVRLPVMNARYAVPWTSCGVASGNGIVLT